MIIDHAATYMYIYNMFFWGGRIVLLENFLGFQIIGYLKDLHITYHIGSMYGIFTYIWLIFYGI